MEIAKAIFAPLVQRVGSVHHETGENVQTITRGISTIVVAIISTTPNVAMNAMRKVQQCEGFDQRDAAALILNYGAGSLDAFRAEMHRITVSVREARDVFLRETDKHLDDRLPALRDERQR